MAHVLIVDDSPTVVEHVSRLLSKNGFKTSSASSAEQGIARARETRPDLILMDVVFPGMSGFQATRRINRDPITSRIPVIILSVRNMDSDKVWGLRQGAREYLTKPCRAEVLIDAVRRNVAAAG
ncbi:MAG: response regulator [Gammaproteobacteria bacterium]|nr:response regulator [Gammaproteobacteria bacterium]